MNNLAMAVGAVGLMGIVGISLYYAVGGFWGTLNDLCNGVMAVLTAVLAWRLQPMYGAQAPRQSRVALAAVSLGALTAVAGTFLVQVTGWYLAGLVTNFGYALIGAWLVGVSHAAQKSLAWPRRLTQFGRVTGAVMSLGVLALPGIVAGVDDMATAPWWANAGLLSGLGWVLLFPVWVLWLGRQLAWHRDARPETAKA